MSWREGDNIKGPAASASKSASSLPSSSGAAAVGPTSIYSVGGSIGASSVVDSTLYLFVVPALGSTIFFNAKHCLRKVAPIGAVRWTNSREGKRSNSKNSKILQIKTRKNRCCSLERWFE